GFAVWCERRGASNVAALALSGGVPLKLFVGEHPDSAAEYALDASGLLLGAEFVDRHAEFASGLLLVIRAATGSHGLKLRHARRERRNSLLQSRVTTPVARTEAQTGALIRDDLLLWQGRGAQILFQQFFFFSNKASGPCQ